MDTKDLLFRAKEFIREDYFYFFSFITAEFLNLYVAEYVIDFFIKKIKKLTEKS